MVVLDQLICLLLGKLSPGPMHATYDFDTLSIEESHRQLNLQSALRRVRPRESY